MTPLPLFASFATFCSISLSLFSAQVRAAEPEAKPDTTPRYKSVGFVKFPDDVTVGAVSAVAIDAKDNVYVLQRGATPLMAWDASGKYLNGWGDKLFKLPHGLRIDARGNIWTTDNANSLIRCFSPRGELLLTLGEGKEADAVKFKSPDDLVFDRSGNMYVADAGSGRILKLSPEGKLLKAWGKKGKADVEFGTAHSIAIDDQDHIYVGDRGNKRVQVFDSEGKHLHTWTGFGNAFGVIVIGNELITTEGDKHQIYHVDRATGKVNAVWGDPESLQLPHLMARDSRGRLYVAEVNGKRVQIFEPVK
jgi:sugar lactone lactonase YvrE